MMYRVKIQGGKTNTDEAAVSKAKIEYQTTTINDDDLNILDMCTNNQWLFFRQGFRSVVRFSCVILSSGSNSNPFLCTAAASNVIMPPPNTCKVTYAASLVTVTFTFQDLLKGKHGGF